MVYVFSRTQTPPFPLCLIFFLSIHLVYPIILPRFILSVSVFFVVPHYPTTTPFWTSTTPYWKPKTSSLPWGPSPLSRVIQGLYPPMSGTNSLVVPRLYRRSLFHSSYLLLLRLSRDPGLWYPWTSGNVYNWKGDYFPLGTSQNSWIRLKIQLETCVRRRASPVSPSLPCCQPSDNVIRFVFLLTPNLVPPSSHPPFFVDLSPVSSGTKVNGRQLTIGFYHLPFKVFSC